MRIDLVHVLELFVTVLKLTCNACAVTQALFEPYGALTDGHACTNE
jgi:hypothetical protein